tara:strand:- start:452 stop:787 length:336 start_codon:yes stop_codon:yes gene_type:complete
MTNFNWCHGPSCHKKEIQSRVRGSKGNKVLRTIKIKPNRYGNYQSGIWNHFCNQRCLMDYIQTHIQSIVAIAPRREPLETPINDPVKETSEYGWINWNIEKKGVDSGNNIG